MSATPTDRLQRACPHTTTACQSVGSCVCAGRWVESRPYIILNKRTAIKRSLARRIMRACAKNSNPSDLAEELLELKSEYLTSLQAQERAPTQPTTPL